MNVVPSPIEKALVTVLAMVVVNEVAPPESDRLLKVVEAVPPMDCTVPLK